MTTTRIMIKITKVDNGYEVFVDVSTEADFFAVRKTYYDMNLKDACQRARQLSEEYFKE